MRFPGFDPKEVPSRPLSVLLDIPPLPNRTITRANLVHALNVPVHLSEGCLLYGDNQVSDDDLRPSAVLILLVESASGFDVLLSVRASGLRHHAGQVSFVGGQIDHGETAQQAALREAYEEIGLLSDDLDIIGELPVYQTITRFSVTPVVAIISEQAWAKQKLNIATVEVDHVFTVPLSYVLDITNIRVHDFIWQNATRQFYSVSFGEYFIWGASMALLRNLDSLLRL